MKKIKISNQQLILSQLDHRLQDSPLHADFKDYQINDRILPKVINYRCTIKELPQRCSFNQEEIIKQRAILNSVDRKSRKFSLGLSKWQTSLVAQQKELLQQQRQQVSRLMAILQQRQNGKKLLKLFDECEQLERQSRTYKERIQQLNSILNRNYTP